MNSTVAQLSRLQIGFARYHEILHILQLPALLSTHESWQSIRRQDSRLSGGSDGTLEAAAALAVANAATAPPEHPRKSAVPSQPTTKERDEIKSRVRLDHDPSVGGPNSSGLVAQGVDEGGEECKEPEVFETVSRSSGSVRPVVDGASAATVVSGSNNVRDDATTVASGSGDLGAGSLETDKFSSGSLGAVNMKRTGYRLKGIVVSYTYGGVLLKGGASSSKIYFNPMGT